MYHEISNVQVSYFSFIAYTGCRIGSGWLSIQLLKFGFGESYHEITRFKQTTVANESVEQLLKSHTSEEGFVTFIGDDGDHNVAALDGKGTFHGMGIIAAITNKGQINTQYVIRERPKTMVKVADLIKGKGVPITSYDYLNSGLETISFQSCRDWKRSKTPVHQIKTVFGMLLVYLLLLICHGPTGVTLCKTLCKVTIHPSLMYLCCPLLT